MKLSIRTQVLFVIVFVLALGFGVQLLFNLVFAQDYYTARKSDTLEDAFYDVAAAYDGTLASIETILYAYEDADAINFFLFSDSQWFYPQEGARNADGSVSSEFLSRMMRGPVDIRLFDPANYSTTPTPTLGGNTSATPVLQLRGRFLLDGEPIYLAITLPLPLIEQSVQTLSFPILLISFCTLVLGVLLAVRLSARLASPLRQIEQVAERLADLDFSSLADEQASCRELSKLAHSINAMSRRLNQAISDLATANARLQADVDHQKQLEQQQRQFVAAVSHEMKTPLTLLELYASNLKDNVEHIDRAYYCDVLIEESRRLSDLVGRMLNLSSLESRLRSVPHQPCALSDLCRALCAKLSPMLADFSVQLDIAPDLSVQGDIETLEQAIANVLRNAAEHTPSGGRIALSLHAVDEDVHICVYNSGSHIADEDLPRLWDSFYRGDKARGRTGGNIGMGLYWVARVLEAHGGHYHAENVSDGVSFSLRLPRFTPRSL